MTVSGEDGQIYEKVPLLSESQTFGEISRVLDFIYKPALRTANQLPFSPGHRHSRSRGGLKLKEIPIASIVTTAIDPRLPHHRSEVAVTALIIGIKEIVQAHGRQYLLQKTLGEMLHRVTKLRYRIFRRIALYMHKYIQQSDHPNAALILKKLEPSVQRPGIHAHNALIRAIEVSGGRPLLDENARVRFIQTLNATLRKLIEQIGYLRSAWDQYFAAYPYREQLRTYADLDCQILQSGSHHLNLVEHWLIEDEVIRKILQEAEPGDAAA